jgi:hypothetical protein
MRTKGLYFSAGMGLFSLYNLQRLAQLSSSGKKAALFGTIFFSYTTFGTLYSMKLRQPIAA